MRAVEVLVPAEGAASTLQGELIRAVDKLWYEGQDNGNVNWGPDFEYFVDMLEYHLVTADHPFLTKDDGDRAHLDLFILRHCGHIAYRLKPQWARTADYAEFINVRRDILTEPDGPDETPDLAYTFSDLYEHLVDCVMDFIEANPAPIPYTPPPWFRH